MSFYDLLSDYPLDRLQARLLSVSPSRVERALACDKLGEDDFLALLSPAAQSFLEPLARRARRLTVQYFGRTIGLYIPLYLSNYCENQCVYCGFHRDNRILRKKLSFAEIESEAEAIAAIGMRHILILTGEAPAVTPLSYLEEAVKLLKNYFASVAIEIFPLEEDGYRRLKMAGADGLTIYQEVYDRDRYQLVHPAGRKQDFRFRLDTPERGCRAGFRGVNIGPLLGLGEVAGEVFLTGIHARWLERNFLDTEISLSLPRMNPAEGGYRPEFVADDRTFVQCLMALRCFLPRAGISISTRESSVMRDNLIPLGVTRFSAGSCTGVGGYAVGSGKSTGQFEITDERSVPEVAAAISAAGYQPVYKDWDLI